MLVRFLYNSHKHTFILAHTLSRAFLTAKSDETLEGDSLYRAFLTAQPDETLEAKFKVNIAFTLPISDTKFIQFKT